MNSLFLKNPDQRLTSGSSATTSLFFGNLSLQMAQSTPEKK
jgi:hypothetical protein